MKMQVIADGSQLLVVTGGYHDHSLSVIDVHSAERTATLDVVKTWDGMAFDAATGTVYLSGGGHAKSYLRRSQTALTVGVEFREANRIRPHDVFNLRC